MHEFNQACQHTEHLLAQCDTTIDALDNAYIHGYLAAATISPETPDDNEIFNNLLDEHKHLATTQVMALKQAFMTEIKALDRLFNTEDDDSIDITPDNDDTLAIWCAGFMEVHFQQTDIWLQGREQAVSELILPFMLLSGLFDEEPEFKTMVRDEHLIEDIKEQLPEVMTELYLLFRE